MVKSLFFGIALILSVFSSSVFACKMAVPPISRHDPTHFVFIGEVVEVIKSVKYKSQDMEGEALGFKVKVTESVQTPQKATHFVVFPLRLTPSCGLSSDPKHLREHFPIGAQVRVVAKEAKVIKGDALEKSGIWLETSIYNRGIFTRNDLNDDLRTSAQSVYDYKSFTERARSTPAEDALFDANYYLPEFEVRKDLLRLQKSTSEAENLRILERMAFYPHVYNLDFLQIARRYIGDAGQMEHLKKQWEQRPEKIKLKSQ